MLLNVFHRIKSSNRRHVIGVRRVLFILQQLSCGGFCIIVALGIHFHWLPSHERQPWTNGT
jgi:hypothetical protein